MGPGCIGRHDDHGACRLLHLLHPEVPRDRARRRCSARLTARAVNYKESHMKKIAFIGLGAMGKPIAERLLEGGYDLTVFDVNRDATASLVAAGARYAASPRAAAEEADAVFAMVPDAPDAEEVALGAKGVVHGIKAGTYYVDMSTIDPITTRRIGARFSEVGVKMIDCPVGRTTKHAREGKLVLMIGGEPADIDAMMPVFERLGDTFIRCGPLGNGTATKCVNNYVAMACNAISAEAFVIGKKAGLTPEHMLQVFGSTMASNAQALQVFPQFALAGNTEPGFMISLGHKDLRLAIGLARSLDCNVPVGQATIDVMAKAVEAGMGRKDCSSLLQMHEEAAGTTVRLTAARG
ncbi:MAG: NAD(P)-dependent oxidoreductase [Variovorax sp.]